MTTPRSMVQIHGLPPWLSWRDAGGQAQGGPADASVNLTILDTPEGAWAWNALEGEWQKLHAIVSGNTVWGLTATYYGASGQNLANVRRIGNVPQNKPILGPSYDQAVPGDVILIPGLAQPQAAPPSPPPPGAQPPPGGDPVPQPGEPPITGAPQPVPDVGFDPPPGWPPTMPWPPVLVDPEPSPEPPGPLPDPSPPTPPVGAEPIQVGAPGAAPPGAIVKAQPASWWTTGRIALVGGLGIGTVALIVWGATRGAKKKPARRRSTRRAPPRRRRRR